VLTPLQRPDGRVVLVDRGWVPFTGLRDRLPGVALKAHGVVTVSGASMSCREPVSRAAVQRPDRKEGGRK